MTAQLKPRYHKTDKKVKTAKNAYTQSSLAWQDSLKTKLGRRSEGPVITKFDIIVELIRQ